MCLQLQRFKDEKALGKEVVNGEKARASPIMKSNSASLYWSVVVFAFMICWVPFWMIVILRRFSSSPRNVELFFMFLLYSSNAVNPFIYAGMSPAFLCKHWHEVHVAYNRRGMSEDAAETPNMEFFQRVRRPNFHHDTSLISFSVEISGICRIRPVYLGLGPSISESTCCQRRMINWLI